MTDVSFADLLNQAKKGAGTIAEGPVVLQCLSADHGVSKSGGDPQIVGSFKILGGQFGGRTMKAWFTMKPDSPESILGFVRDMSAFGLSEQYIISLGNPDDMAMAKISSQMVNKIVGAEVYHQPDNRNPGQKSAWLQRFKVHNGPVPQQAPNGAAPTAGPAPAPAPAAPQYQQQAQPQFHQMPATAPQPYAQPQAPAPQPQYQQPQPQYGQPAPAQPQYQQAPAPQPAQAQPQPAPGYAYPQNGQQPQAPAPQGQQPQPQALAGPQPVPPQNAVDDPPF